MSRYGLCLRRSGILLLFFFQIGFVFAAAPSPAEYFGHPMGADKKVVGLYPSERLLKSGWILGEKKITDKAAVVDIAYGKGRVLLLGFGVQNRPQTQSTFPLLFNACYLGNAKEETV